VPDHLRPIARATPEEIERDAVRGGYRKAQARRFAVQYLLKLGRVRLAPPSVDGFVFRGTPYVKDGGRVAFLGERTKGRGFDLFDRRGRSLGLDEPFLAAAVSRVIDAGWVLP
jgi:hypothetical protein